MAVLAIHIKSSTNMHYLLEYCSINGYTYEVSHDSFTQLPFSNFSSQVSRCWQPLGVEGACAWGCCPCCQGGAMPFMPFMPFVATGGAGGGMLSLGSGNFAGLVWSASGALGFGWWVMWLWFCLRWCCWYHDTYVSIFHMKKQPLLWHMAVPQTEIENVLTSWPIPINASRFSVVPAAPNPMVLSDGQLEGPKLGSCQWLV